MPAAVEPRQVFPIDKQEWDIERRRNLPDLRSARLRVRNERQYDRARTQELDVHLVEAVDCLYAVGCIGRQDQVAPTLGLTQPPGPAVNGDHLCMSAAAA
jgi:hypothetical protein